MVGPIRFVFTLLWIGIALSTAGTVRSCTESLAQKATYSQKNEVLSLGHWNRKLLDGKK